MQLWQQAAPLEALALCDEAETAIAAAGGAAAAAALQQLGGQSLTLCGEGRRPVLPLAPETTPRALLQGQGEHTRATVGAVPPPTGPVERQGSKGARRSCRRQGSLLSTQSQTTGAQARTCCRPTRRWRPQKRHASYRGERQKRHRSRFPRGSVVVAGRGRCGGALGLLLLGRLWYSVFGPSAGVRAA